MTMSKSSIGKFIMVLLFGAFIVLTACDEDNNVNKDMTNVETNDDHSGNLDHDENEQNVDEDNLEPVTLLMMTHWNDGQFEHHFKNHLEEKYPHITLEHVRATKDDIEEEVFAKDLKPDIIMTSVDNYYLDIDLLLDLNPLIDSFNFDLDRLDPSIVNYLEEMSNEGELNGLPFVRPEYALVYNPDIFDMFGVDYPTDNMTWDEVIELARQVTGEKNGVQFRGLHPGLPGLFEFMLQQVENSHLVDPDTHEPVIEQNEPFKIYLQRLETIYSIPGNEMNPGDGEGLDERAVNVMRRGQLAMAADRAFASTYADKSAETGLNFDFVTYPRWGGEHGDYGPNEPGNGLVVTTISEHPEEAFRAIEYFLSDEYQTWQAAEGNVPAVVSQEVRDAYLQENEHYDILKDKNLAAITNAQPAPLPIKSQYESEILGDTNYGEDLANGEDINTIIRKMQEQAEGKAKEIQSKQ